MIQKGENGVEYIVRYARDDQFPEGVNLQNMARDSVIRYANHFGLEFRWDHDFYGEIWKNGVPKRIYYWRSMAIVTKRLTTSPALPVRCAQHGKVLPHYRCEESERWLDDQAARTTGSCPSQVEGGDGR